MRVQPNYLNLISRAEQHHAMAREFPGGGIYHPVVKGFRDKFTSVHVGVAVLLTGARDGHPRTRTPAGDGALPALVGAMGVLFRGHLSRDGRRA